MIDSILAKVRCWRMKTLKPFGNIPTGKGLKLTIGDRNGNLAGALAEAFSGVPDVEVIEGNLLDAGCEAVVSPANSFGDMGGGIDKAIDDYHHGAAQRALRAAIASHFLGELPVGMAIVVALTDRRMPYLVAAPTMRVPGQVTNSLNAYLSMRAALVAVSRHNEVSQRPIHTLAVPGLCTGIGGMPAGEAAAQMRTAYDQIIGENWRKVFHPAMAPYVMKP